VWRSEDGSGCGGWCDAMCAGSAASAAAAVAAAAGVLCHDVVVTPSSRSQ